MFPDKDKHGRPIVMMRPRLEDTKTHESQIKFLIYDLEMASAMADRDGERELDMSQCHTALKYISGL